MGDYGLCEAEEVCVERTGTADRGETCGVRVRDACVYRVDKMIGMTLTASVIGAAITLVELWSASASMLILFPNFLFLKLLRKALTGEIASKLGIEPWQVEEVLGDGIAFEKDGTSKPLVTDEQVESARKRAYKPRRKVKG